MGGALTDSWPGEASLKRRPLVLELVGPAGAGKSSLLQALSQRERTIRAGLRIPKHRYIPDAFLSLPTFVDLHRPYRVVLWKEMKRILFLKTLHRFLEQEASRNYTHIMLDEGPVYMLSRIQVFGEEKIKNNGFQEWWQSALKQWAKSLDIIVWLDASDSILTQRIRARGTPRGLQNKSDQAIYNFLARYRTAYEQVISGLTAHQGPKVISFCEGSSDQIAHELLARVHESV